MFRARRIYSSFAAAITVCALMVVACAKRDADLFVSTDAIDFGSQATEVSFTVTNGGEDTGLTNGVSTLDYEITDNQAWLTVTPATGTAGEGQTNTHVARIDRSALILGNNIATIEIESNGGSWTISVNADKVPSSCVDPPSEPWNPSPGVGATGVAINANLMWSEGNSQCGLGATYQVFFGTSSPPPLDHDNGTSKSWDPGPLEYATTYYWRIVAVDANGSTSGDEWSFTTASAPCTTAPTAPAAPNPGNGATVGVTPNLSWSEGESQCNGLTATYDVYFGTSNPPPFSHTNGTAKIWSPATLQYATTYYWKVVAKDPNGETSGLVWSFDTQAAPCTSAPTAVTLTAPANGANNVAITQDLSWGGGNSQCPALTATYDVYFGTTSPPPFDHNNGTAKTWDPGTLEYSTTYYWRIVATDGNGETSSSERVFTTQAAPCTAGPTAVTLTAPTSGATDVPLAQDLSWSGGDSQCNGLTATYDVYFGTASPPPLAGNNLAVKTYDPGNLQYSTTYYWRVDATDANGSMTSFEQSFTTVAAPCTAGPTQVALTSPANGATGQPTTVNLVWSAGDSQCPGLTATYDVYFGTNATPPLNHNNGSTKTWTTPTLVPETTYYWRIVAKDANGETTSGTRSFTTQAAPCTAAPGAVSLTAPVAGATNVPIAQDLSWSGGDSQCPGLTATHDVYLGTTNPPPVVANDLAVKTYDPGTLQYSTTYFWRVIATDGNGSTSSTIQSFTTVAAPCTAGPTAVALVSPANGATDQPLTVDLSWNGGDSQCPALTATYDVYFGTSATPPLDHNNGSTKSWSTPTLVPETTYYWRIVAKDANGESSSSTRSFTTEAAPCTAGPGAVTLTAPTDGATDVPIAQDLAWSGGDSQCPGLTATYDVFFGTSPSPSLALDDASVKTWDPGDLQFATTYYWRVVATDANGSISSFEQSFTTAAVPCTDGPTAVVLESPADGATDVPTAQDLSWSGGDSQCSGLTATYDVYFGTTPAPPLVGDDVAAKTYEPGTLGSSTTYYWRVVATDANGSSSSEERSFTTAAVACTDPPAAVTLTSPSNGSFGVPVDDDLTWTGGDSQCSGLTATYDVYFGNTTPPPLIQSNVTSKTFDPGTLSPDTDYYWRIVATDDNGSTSSETWSFATASVVCNDAPTAPAIVAPSNASSNVTIEQVLSWTGGDSRCNGLTATYDVNFGTTSPPPFNHNNGTAKTWDPGALSYSTTYYWQIVAKDANGATGGPVWSFTTEPCVATPTVVCTPTPANGRTGVSEKTNLAWQCGDSQCPGLTPTYDVYFGTSPTPGFRTTTTSKSLNLPDLQKNTTFYWQIITHDANGTTAGPIWSFTTKE